MAEWTIHRIYESVPEDELAKLDASGAAADNINWYWGSVAVFMERKPIWRCTQCQTIHVDGDVSENDVVRCDVCGLLYTASVVAIQFPIVSEVLDWLDEIPVDFDRDAVEIKQIREWLE